MEAAARPGQIFAATPRLPLSAAGNRRPTEAGLRGTDRPLAAPTAAQLGARAARGSPALRTLSTRSRPRAGTARAAPFLQARHASAAVGDPDARAFRMSVMLIDALSARRGGGQTYLLNLLTRLPPGEPAKIYLLARRELDEHVSSDRVQVLQPRWPMHNGLLLTIWKKLFLRRYAERLGASLLFFPGGIVSAAVPAGTRCVTMFRNVIPFDMTQRRRYGFGYQRLRNWALERVMLKGMLDADLVIFLSEYGR